MPTRRERVRQRAEGRCEYCRMADAYSVLPHGIDHIKPLKHHGPTTLANLCWACALCNACKSSNVAGYDPTTRKLSRLFNPRTDEWGEHFRWGGPKLEGMSAIGRATIEVLRINDGARVEHRRLLLREGLTF
jgi:hypothetical protein